MGRQRLAKNRSLPPNLYQNSAGYFYFKNPDSNKTKGIGKDKAAAMQEARSANAALAAKTPSSLVDWVMGKTDYTLKEWLPIYRDLWEQRYETAPAANTLRSCTMYLKKIDACDYAHMKLRDVGTAHVAKHLLAVEAGSGPAAAINLRARLSDVFRMAETQGLISQGANPVKATYNPNQTVKRERLSLEQFVAIRALAPVWLQRAMNLALVTAQRREDLTNMKFADYKDGHLHVDQGKTGTRLRISGEIRLAAINISVEEAVSNCRDLIVSRHLIHHVARVSRVKPGDKVDPNGLSNAFQKARDAAGIVAEDGRTPPSFHEIRSLAERLYKVERSAEFAQALLGHKHASMTAKYDDLRGKDWAVVS
ncbi:tyrosine-type recombinase/integrase [Rugamonas sp.]|uniref:tyrosine-type recombinase/integrase n=1 Tax=Rugamonas sp. TaxID=1926287 RepID=UPI0025EABECC|nr:tyrosine-type recombinase/integrase [Rugamonas sp.]